jgi:hypothetical protein
MPAARTTTDARDEGSAATWIRTFPDGLPPDVQTRLRIALQSIIDTGETWTGIEDKTTTCRTALSMFLDRKRSLSVPAAARLARMAGLKLTLALEPAEPADARPSRRPNRKAK